ncbi:MAG: hypothetical protein ACR2JC_11245 [Chloroflexota bacterium]
MMIGLVPQRLIADANFTGATIAQTFDRAPAGRFALAVVLALDQGGLTRIHVPGRRNR